MNNFYWLTDPFIGTNKLRLFYGTEECGFVETYDNGYRAVNKYCTWFYFSDGSLAKQWVISEAARILELNTKKVDDLYQPDFVEII